MHFETSKKKMNLSCPKIINHNTMRYPSETAFYIYFYKLYVKFKIYIEKDASNKMHKILVVKSKSNQFIVCVCNDYGSNRVIPFFACLSKTMQLIVHLRSYRFSCCSRIRTILSISNFQKTHLKDY